MAYLKSLLLGATTFAVAHVIETRYWAWFGTYGGSPWFVASPRAMAFTAGCMAMAALIVVGFSRDGFADLCLRAFVMVIGAFIVSVITLFMSPTGPGNLFPFALLVGAWVLFAGSMIGIALSYLIRRKKPAW